MCRFFLFSLLLSTLLTAGFGPTAQVSAATLRLLDRTGQTESQITDGDTVRLQLTLPQAAAQATTIDFRLEGTTAVGSCVVEAKANVCETQAFPALGWYWGPNGQPQNAIHLQAVQREAVIAQSDVILIKPRPVVLVHGFISNWETWKPYLGPDGFLASLGLAGFAVGDGQVAGALNTGQMLEPTGRTNTLGQNAQVLAQYIANVKEKTGAQMVDLVVHSMGGMISRYYIDRLMQDRDVAQLIMLGSPMGGSDCAVLPAALGFFLPASIEIRESYMRGVFNQQITHRRGIEFHDLAGTAILDPFKSPCTSVPNDTVVGVDSVNAIPLTSAQIADIHGNLTSSRPAFQSYVRPLLQKPAGSFLPQPDPPAAPQAEAPLDFTRVYTGRVDFGGSTDLTIQVEANLTVAAFALYDPSRSVTTVVRGASGNVIELTPERNGLIKIEDPASMLYLGYGFQNPKPGPWQISVQATETTPPNGTDFAITVYFIGGARLQSASTTLVPRPNEPVMFTASLDLGGELLNIQSAQAVIRASDGSTQTVDFPAGQRISATWTPSTPGTYAVDIVVTGLAPDGSTIERTDFLAVEVQSNPTQGQIAFNLVALIAGVVLVLGLVLYGFLRGAGRVLRRSRR